MNKRYVKISRRIEFLVCILLPVFLLTSCGSKKFLGTYHASASFHDCMTADEQEKIREEGLDSLNDLSIPFAMTLNEDQTFSLSIDDDALKNEFHDTMKDIITSVFKQKWIGIGITEEQFDSLAKQNGYDGFDAFVDAYIVELNELADTFLDDPDLTGTWSKEKKTILLNDVTATIQKDNSLTISMQQGNGFVELNFVKE